MQPKAQQGADEGEALPEQQPVETETHRGVAICEQARCVAAHTKKPLLETRGSGTMRQTAQAGAGGALELQDVAAAGAMQALAAGGGDAAVAVTGEEGVRDESREAHRKAACLLHEAELLEAFAFSKWRARLFSSCA